MKCTVSLREMTTRWRHIQHAVTHHQVQLIGLECRTSPTEKPRCSSSNTNQTFEVDTYKTFSDGSVTVSLARVFVLHWFREPTGGLAFSYPGCESGFPERDDELFAATLPQAAGVCALQTAAGGQGVLLPGRRHRTGAFKTGGPRYSDPNCVANHAPDHRLGRFSQCVVRAGDDACAGAQKYLR